MRQGSFTLDNLMRYIYGEQISKIPAKMYNDDAQVKYLDFGSLYTYCCHGSKEHQIRRWLRERIAYVDSMLGYFTSQEDQVTIRMNKDGKVSFDVTPYIPLYFSVKWSNATGGTQTFKLKRGETKTFNYSSTTSTDQEVIIYHAKYIKRLDNLSNLNPSSCILSNAVKLTNVEIHSSELYNINVTNNKFLRSINLENCTALGTVTATGSSLNLSNCKYLRYCNVYNTHLTEVQLNTSGGSLTEIYYPKSIQSINLVKQRLLELIGLPYGEGGKEVPTSLYTISIQDCPSITKLNTSSDPTIASSFASMVYVNNLTIRNSLDLASLKFDGFHRLQNVTIENMYNLEEVGFNNLLPVGETSTIKYIGMSNCPKLGTIELNCTSNDYEITFADDAILNFGGLFKLNSITSNCVLKGIKTIVVPINLESMFFTSEYGSGYSTIENIWVSSQCNVDTQATTPIVTHVDPTYSGIDFLGMNLKNIDLGALVNIPKAINFKLSPTTVNPHFNLNRDGETYKYLQPVGTLDLSNYTESLAKFFDGVDLDKLEIICNSNLPQTDLSYCFYNSSFSTNDAINKLLTKVSSITNLNYCFYRTTINSVDILEDINMGESSSMNYTFAECPNIKELNSVVIPSNVTSVEGMFNKCPLTVINNMVVNVRGSISGLFKGCNKLTTINTLRIPNVTDVSGTFEGCTSLSSLSGFELPTSCTNVSNLFKGCYMLTELGMNFSSNITAGDNWYPPNLEALHDTTISNDHVKLTNCTTLKTLNGVNISGGDLSDLFNGCINLVNINNCTFNATTSLARAFKGCSKITINPITTIVDTVTDISEMYSGCTGITNISGMTFGSGITNSTDCIKDVPLVYANDITIKSFFKTADNFKKPVIVFTDCASLVSAKNLKLITSLDGINVIDMFARCTNLVDVNFVNPPKFGYCQYLFNNTSIGKNTNGIVRLYEDLGITTNTLSGAISMGMFCNNPYIKEFIFPDEEFESFSAQQLFDACTNLKIVRNLKSRYLGNMFRFCKGATNVELINCYITNPFVSDGCKEITKLTNCTIPSNVTNIDRFFTGMNIQNDIEIPSHVTSCVETFKNCTKITNIHANWNNTYDNGITSTDCYSGCTGIEQIDGESVVLYPGDNSLDYIPKEWGGYGLVGEYTSVFEINIPKDNYEIRFCNYGIGFIYSSSKAADYYSENNSISWGDGSYLTKSDILNDPNYDSDKGGIKRTLVNGFPTHTYKKAGTYYVKGNFYGAGYGYAPGARECITRYLKLPCKSDTGMYLTSYSGEFWYCGNLTYVDLSNIKNNPILNLSNLFNRCTSLTLDNIIGLNDLNLSNVTNMSGMFENSSNITQLPFTTIPDSVTNIDSIFKNTGITDISGLTIGSGVTSATDWITDSSITTADNVTIKNDVVKFNNCTTLDSCNNFKITSNVTKLEQTFQNCSNLTSFSFSDESNFSNLITMYETFDSCSKLTVLNLSNVVCTSKLTSINELCKNCASLTTLYLPSNLQDSSITVINGMAPSCRTLKTIYNLYLPDGFVEFGAYSLGWVGTIEPKHAIDIIGFRVPNTTTPATVFAKVNKMFKTFSNVIWPETTTNIAGMFKDLIHLTHDLEISSHITNCENAFNGCTSMTHIHSNWNNTYASAITSTDCYVGCTGITHIDDENVIAYAGDSGLDYVPTAWGGKGFDEIMDYCGVYELTIPSNNYTFTLAGDLVSMCINNVSESNYTAIVNWGDGTTDTNLHNGDTHTYTTSGTYYLKGNVVNGKSGLPFQAVITKILRHPKIINNPQCSLWTDCSKLIYADVSNFNPSLGAKTLEGFLRRCTQLNNDNVIGLENLDTSGVTSCKSAFDGAGFTSLDLRNWNMANTISIRAMFASSTTLVDVNCSGWDMSSMSECIDIFLNCTSLQTINLSNWKNMNKKSYEMRNFFYNCSSLTSLDLTSWDTSTVTSMEKMFCNCSALTNIKGIENWDTSNVWSVLEIFKSCTSLSSFPAIENWDLSNCAVFDNMFHKSGCCGTFRPNWNLANIGNGMARGMTYMFGEMKGTSDTIIDLSNCTVPKNHPVETHTGYMFANNNYITQVKFPNNLKVGSMDNVFKGCSKLTTANLRGLDLSECTSMASTFYYCTSLTSVLVDNTLNTSKLTNMNNMLSNCTSLTSFDFLLNFNTSSVTNMSGLFDTSLIDDASLASIIAAWDFSKVTTIGQMLYNCKNITKIDFTGKNLNSVTSITKITDKATNLETFIFPLDNNNVITDWQSIFSSEINLKTVKTFNLDRFSLGSNFNRLACAYASLYSQYKYEIDFTFGGTLSKEGAQCFFDTLTYIGSARGILNKISAASWERMFRNNLHDYSGTSTSAKLQLSDTVLAKLTSAQIAIATNKGWTLQGGASS